jgi:hypothetical protein
MVDINARMVGAVSEIKFAPPPAPSAATVVAVPPKDRLPQCAPDDSSPVCVLARLQQGAKPAAVAKAVICPASPPPKARVDQLERSYDHPGAGFTRSTLAGLQVASYFALVSATTVSMIEWSGSVQHADLEERFVIRIYSDLNGEPGRLVYEAPVAAQSRSVREPGYQGRGHPFVFSAQIGPIQLAAGQYWLSVIDPKSSGMDFMWGTERGAGSGSCGSGGAWRRGEKGPWLQIYDTVPHRSARGYSFRVE